MAALSTCVARQRTCSKIETMVGFDRVLLATTSVPHLDEVEAPRVRGSWGEEAEGASTSSRLRGAVDSHTYSGCGLDSGRILMVRTAPSASEK